MGDEETLRVLTVKQPWAAAIAYGTKRVENRTWLPKYRGPLAIHAGLALDDTWRFGLPDEHPMVEWARSQASVMRPMVAGAILAVCELVDAHAQNSPRCRCDGWGVHVGGTTHLVLADVRALPQPIPFKGGLGLRTADESLIAALAGDGPKRTTVGALSPVG